MLRENLSWGIFPRKITNKSIAERFEAARWKDGQRFSTESYGVEHNDIINKQAECVEDAASHRYVTDQLEALTNEQQQEVLGKYSLLAQINAKDEIIN